MNNIRGKTIAITGAARGIGYATAKALLERGATVVIGDRDLAALRMAVDALMGVGRASGHPLDVTDGESFTAFLNHARVNGGGHVDVLINNAGVMPIGSYLDQSEAAIRSAVEVNLYGVLTGCRLVLPEMVARGRGHIVNIASTSGLVAVPGQVIYAGTKFAVVGLSTAMADEFAPHGVEVSVVLPPFTNTDLITGTRSTATSRPVEPTRIAQAIVGVLDRPKTHVSIPATARFFATLTTLLGPRGRRWLNRRIGVDDLFLDFDVAARQPYENRAEAARGIEDQTGAD